MEVSGDTSCPTPTPLRTNTFLPPPAAAGKYAIVAMPPWLTGRITYSPAMPQRRVQLTQRAPMVSAALQGGGGD